MAFNVFLFVCCFYSKPLLSILFHCNKEERSAWVIACEDLDKHQSGTIIEPGILEMAEDRLLKNRAEQITMVDFLKSLTKNKAFSPFGDRHLVTDLQ